jgi:hypothetical protein
MGGKAGALFLGQTGLVITGHDSFDYYRRIFRGGENDLFAAFASRID